jgi:hypothetical protein
VVHLAPGEGRRPARFQDEAGEQAHRAQHFRVPVREPGLDAAVVGRRVFALGLVAAVRLGILPDVPEAELIAAAVRLRAVTSAGRDRQAGAEVPHLGRAGRGAAQKPVLRFCLPDPQLVIQQAAYLGGQAQPGPVRPVQQPHQV